MSSDRPICKEVALSAAVALLATCAAAEIGWNDGAVAHRSLPSPQVSAALVRLDVPHIRQGRNLCVPTSAAMVLRYFGDPADPAALKAMAEGHKPKSEQNRDFTLWKDMGHALSQMGYRRNIRNFPKTNGGFTSGMKQIKRHLQKGLPVLIEVHQDAGHTFVLTGYDDARGLVFVRDPNLPRNRSREISYSVLRENWHNHQFGSGRSAFFAFPKR